MQYRTMPGSDEKLSVLGYGCMRLPTRFGGAASSSIDKDRAVAQIRGAIDAGVNYIDTAWPYHLGHSESFLGERVLTDGYREKVNIATKLPCMLIRKRESMDEIFAKQLQKLRVDCIDYYLCHSLDGKVWDSMVEMGITEFLDRIRREGKIRRIGFSFHGRKADFMRIVDAYDWDFAQVQFNILDESFQAGIEGIRYAHSKGMGIIVMEPLRGGSLVGKIPGDVRKIYDTADIKRSPADWAMRWIYNHPEVTVVLSGMNEEAHIEENIAIAEDSLPGSMTGKEEAIISEVRDTYNRLLQVGCTGCAYCMPCPAGIDIPAAFKNLNNFHMFGKMEPRMYHMMYLGIQTPDGKPHWTSACIDCGKCEKACPQGIPIRSVFPQVRKDLEGPMVRAAAATARLFMGRRSGTSEGDE